MNVQLFIPCFVDQLYPQVGISMWKVLEKAGCQVQYNPKQTCCGQPAFNAGFHEDARDVCSKFMRDFAGTDYIVAPSASCIGFVKNYYPTLFPEGSESTAPLAARVFELSEFLVDVLGVEDLGARFAAQATYHDSCAALRELHIKSAPRRLLAQVKGLTLTEMAEAETCCGFGGTFAVKFQAISSAMADQKLHHATATGARIIISTDMSCLMHIQGYADQQQKGVRCLHLAEVLAMQE